MRNIALASLISLCVFAGAASSAPDPSAAVLAAARAAHGDWRGGVLVETGREEASGLKGRWRLAQDTARGRMHQTVDFGVYRLADVWDGRLHWRQEHSGGVHALNSAFARGNAATDMWLARRGFLRADAGGAKIAWLKTRTDGGRRYAMLRATPPGGQAVELWFDAKTGLLARSRWTMPTEIVTVRYDDYRRVGAAVVPFRTVSQSEGGDPDAITVEHAAFAAHAEAGEFTPPHNPDDSTVAGGSVTVPIEYNGDVIVDAMLNGKGPFRFILDTGGHDILTPDAAKALGLDGVGAGQSGGAGAGTLTEQYTRVDKVEIGGVTLRDQSFIILPLQYNTVEMGPKPVLAGILGVELFERFAMELNYRAQTLTFRPIATAPPGHGVPLPITFTDDQPIFTAKIDGIAGDNGLDTGNGGSLVVQGRWAQAHGLSARMRQGLVTAGFGAGGISQNWAVRADVEVAGVKFPRVVASYAEDKKGAFSSRTEAGNIGNQIYQNFTLSFDYGRGIVWFDPQPGGPQPPMPYARAGMSAYKAAADAFTIVVLLPNGPAAEAGLAVGDEITAVNGTPARELSGWDMRHIVRGEPETKLTLDVKHGDAKRTVVLTLRELLP